ncbi:Cell wall surface anchored protein [Rhodotorula toruloides ATCC 204091]|uniref:BY PROTMAP: gi/342319479/gb/EGU11427.1/ Cell wall surface anchored protein [Rhodotorula glutinis ATCC 204091] n=1 Tax=Rhodotorula toruloides TaxID=5286 RepID=A0A0K3CPP2_RHOTO|nr:Cell wall surface anchored protein [Rhodotorula toruloides ATCC 204091]
MLASLSSSVQGFLARSSSHARLDAAGTGKEGAGVAELGQEHATSSTTQHYSPTSLSASGNQTIQRVLDAHPHFSVFRKSASVGSLDELARKREEEDESPIGRRASLGVRDLRDAEEEVETLATPPNQSPAPSPRLHQQPNRPSPARTASDSSGSSFHLDSAEMPSLNFGDQSSSISLSPGPGSAGSSPAPSVVSGTPSGGVRLVPDSPPITRTPARSRSVSTASSASSQSSKKSSTTTSSSTSTLPPHVARIQFSPLSLCPSPLLHAPSLPPPPAPPTFESPTEAAGIAGGEKGILKRPRTPGTGRSVSKLKAVIPSPDSSLVSPPSPPPSPPKPQEPTLDSVQGPGGGQGPMLFDESNPFIFASSSTSVSVSHVSQASTSASFAIAERTSATADEADLTSRPPVSSDPATEAADDSLSLAHLSTGTEDDELLLMRASTANLVAPDFGGKSFLMVSQVGRLLPEAARKKEVGVLEEIGEEEEVDEPEQVVEKSVVATPRAGTGKSTAPRVPSPLAQVTLVGDASTSSSSSVADQYTSPSQPASTSQNSQSSTSFYRLFMSTRASRFVEVAHEEGGIRAVERAGNAEDTVVEHAEARGVFLSPIVEVVRPLFLERTLKPFAYLRPTQTEPESDANTPFERGSGRRLRARSQDPPPPQPTFSLSLAAKHLASSAPPATPGRSTASALPPKTPRSASKIPRPRNPITPSQNPFLLQLARSGPDGAPPSRAATLLQDLFSTQQDQLATSASQRFILSSLVTNLQNEVEHKDAMVANLKRQVQEARAEAKEIERLALEWEDRALHAREGESVKQDEKKIAALEETVSLLADELETRMRDDRALRQAFEADLERLRRELDARTAEVREGEIRLRYARIAQDEAEEARDALRDQVEREKSRRAEVERERNEVKARWAFDVEERDNACARLREEIEHLKATSPSARGAVFDEAQVAEEVERRVASIRQEADRNVHLARQELAQRDASVADLRDELRSHRDEVDRLTRAVQEERQHAELANADLEALLQRKEQELEEALGSQALAHEELEATYARLDAAEVERDNAVNAVNAANAKEVELAQQIKQCEAALAAMADLDQAVARIEAEASAKDEQLASLRADFEAQRLESADVLAKRDAVLAEAECEASILKKDLEALQKENNRLSDLVAKLRRDSADREVKVAKLKKRAAELEEDVFGLNVALDAKQQEASHWKRQMSSLKLERERATSVSQVVNGSAIASTSVSRSVLAPTVPASSRTSKTSARRSSVSKRQHATTPFPADKHQAAATTARRVSISVPASRATTDTDDEEFSHDLTLPPLHAGNEETPIRPIQPGVRRTSSATSLSSGMSYPGRIAKERERLRSRKESEDAKENTAPAPARRIREAVLA